MLHDLSGKLFQQQNADFWETAFENQKQRNQNELDPLLEQLLDVIARQMPGKKLLKRTRKAIKEDFHRRVEQIIYEQEMVPIVNRINARAAAEGKPSLDPERFRPR